MEALISPLQKTNENETICSFQAEEISSITDKEIVQLTVSNFIS